MRKLEVKEIEKLASREGVRRIAVENFLFSMGNNAMNVYANLAQDAGSYGWNAKTVNAIRAGINLAMKG